jgi:hypothetical protein
MNFINKSLDTFAVAICDYLALRAPYREPIYKWVRDTLVKKGLIKTGFMAGYLLPVQYEKTGTFVMDDDPDFGATYFVRHPAGPALKDVLTGLTDYEKKDARAGFLYAIDTNTSVHGIVFLLGLPSIKDFLVGMLTEDPNVQLSKYVWPTVQKQSQDWHTEQEKLKAKADRLEWNKLKDKKDWWKVGESKDGRWTLLRLCTKAALVYEAQKQHICIDTYDDYLYDGQTLLLSLRKSENLAQPVCTLEVRLVPPRTLDIGVSLGRYSGPTELTTAGALFRVIQFMRACNVAVREAESEHLAFLECFGPAFNAFVEGDLALMPLLRFNDARDMTYRLNT